MENESEQELFTGPSLQRVIRSVSTPGEAEDVIQQRLKALGMTFQEYVASLIAYDCWAEKPHHFTGDVCKGHRRGKRAREDESRLWREIIADFGKADKVGSFFEHRVAELVLRRLRQK